MPLPYSPAQIKAARKGILNTFKGCYKGEIRAAFYRGTEEEKIALALVAEGKLTKLPKNADMGGDGDKRYTYFCPAFDTFDYRRSDGKGGWIEPHPGMKSWK